MSSALPYIPQYLFGIAEPAVLIIAFAVTSLLPQYYVSSQLNLNKCSRPLLPTEQICIFQISNLFLLVAVISLYVLNSTNDVQVARAFLTALWWGDLGHLGVTLWCLGWTSCRDVGSWSLVVWGNIGIPAFLFTMRTLYFLGVWASDSSPKY